MSEELASLSQENKDINATVEDLKTALQRAVQKNRTDCAKDVNQELTEKLQQSEAKKRKLYELARTLDEKEN